MSGQHPRATRTLWDHSVNKELLKDFERQSGIDVYALGLDRTKWDHALEKFADALLTEFAYDCMDVTSNVEAVNFLAKKWGVEL